jgi:serine incorporator 1/3
MVMFISTVRTVKVNDRRNSWHCGWWAVKIAIFIACSTISTLVPSGWIQLYGQSPCFCTTYLSYYIYML